MPLYKGQKRHTEHKQQTITWFETTTIAAPPGSQQPDNSPIRAIAKEFWCVFKKVITSMGDFCDGDYRFD